jgi:hypothetical protein
MRAPAADEDDRHCDRLLARLPGAQADVVVKALNLEGIPCLLECQGIRRLCLPDREPGEPLAVTLPVSIYVQVERMQEAQDILDSSSADVIGEQWAEEPQAAEVEETVEAEAAPAHEETRSPDLPALHSEGTTWRVIAIIAVGLFLLLMWFSR